MAYFLANSVQEITIQKDFLLEAALMYSHLLPELMQEQVSVA